MGFLKSIFGSSNERTIKAILPLVTKINELEAKISPLSDSQLQAKTGEFKERIAKGETLDDLLPEAFAVVREASKRVLGMRHFDVQLVGGIVLHQGRIAEMKTGEGKTLCATAPVYLNALSGKGVHLVTVNDYLATRDSEWMGQIYNFLGLSVGVIVNSMGHKERQDAYGCDITYGQNNEFGFDYLRDNMKMELDERVQRGYNFAIVDEVDSILVDEARTPLIISGPSQDKSSLYEVADKIARQFKLDEHYTVELKSKQTLITEEGVSYAEKLLGVENLYDPGNIELVHHVQQAIKAHATMKRDFDYVVRNNEVVIVDEFTGRLMAGRRWSDGLHQAVEAKEKVKIQRENQTLATITFQNYFRMYKKLSGMTGTADTEAVEFKKIYNLDVVAIPTNRPVQRIDYPDVIFSSEAAKYRAVCDEIAQCAERGQPVLVGTASIARSEILSGILKKRGVPHHVLNAKQHEREAEIIAQAGRFGAVTISTNMAGRGTDIVLGGNPESLAANEAGTKDHNDEEFQAAYRRFKAECEKEREKVVAAGGLFVIGTERHESRRIDNQLRGRSGRQGDAGASRFYVALDDDLMKRFGGERIQAIMQRVGMKEDDAIEGSMIAAQIERAQKRVEGHNFEIRKHLLDYDNVMNKQREVIYSLREQFMQSTDVQASVLEMVGDIVEEIVLSRADEKTPAVQWDIEGIVGDYARTFGIRVAVEEYKTQAENIGQALAQQLFDDLKANAEKVYLERMSRFGQENFLKLQRIILLQGIDFFWKEHLSNVDHLKEGIGLRGYSQKNPLHEYQQEAFTLFATMLTSAKAAILQNIFQAELLTREEIAELERQEKEARAKREEAARAVHQETLGAGSESTESAEAESGNREQRRKLEKQKKKAR